MKITEKFNTFDDFMQKLIDMYIDKENFHVICSYEVAKDFCKKFLSFNDETRIYDINIEHPEPGIDGYFDEYVITVVDNDLFVEKMRINGKIISCSDEVVTFVQKDFVSEDITDSRKHYIPNLYIEFSIKGYDITKE